MIPQLEQALLDSGYADLPECLKQQITPKEWQWLSDGEKARYVQNETEPGGYDE